MDTLGRVSHKQCHLSMALKELEDLELTINGSDSRWWANCMAKVMSTYDIQLPTITVCMWGREHDCDKLNVLIL